VTQDFRADYRAFAANGGSAAPVWLRELREAGLARFEARGFPSTREEEWRFTSVAPIAETRFTLRHDAPATDAAAKRLGALTPLHALVFVDGFFVPALSAMGPLPAGVRVTNLAAAITAAPDLVRRDLGRHASVDKNPFTALATAFLRDGAFVHVPARAIVPEPLQLLFVSTGGAEAHVSHPRTLLVLEDGSAATIVETYLSADPGVHLTNAVTEIVLGDGARLSHARVQRESESAFHVATTQSRQGRDSTFASTSVVLGAALARHDITATLAGTGGSLVLNGLSVLETRQHADHHTTIDHAQPHCESHELFNGIFDDQSRGVFNGRIIVRPGAQRTDSKQTNNNVLLSEHARADSQPQLEIYADDVKCTHGSTVGPLDPKAMFYLRSRGLDETEARRLLTYGFAAEILNRMDVAPLRAQLDGIVRARLAAS
jgi:Fe-S cluster assembly protein SufD